MLQCVHACGCAESVVSTLAGRSDGCLGCKSFTPEFVRSSWRNCRENPTTTQQRLIFESFESYCYAHFSTSHRGKTHCFSRKTGSTCTWVCSCVCVQGVGENRMPGRLPISTPSTDSSVSIHQLSVWELPTRIWYQTEERKKQPARTIFALSQQMNHKLVCLWRIEWTEAVRGNRVFTCIWRRVADP